MSINNIQFFGFACLLFSSSKSIELSLNSYSPVVISVYGSSSAWRLGFRLFLAGSGSIRSDLISNSSNSVAVYLALKVLDYKK
jgi:hypothetical protein